MSEQTMSDTDLMRSFLDQHGEAPKDETPETPESRVSPPKEEDLEHEELESLDAATLKALGLEGEEEAPKGESGEGDDAGKPAVDLEALARALGLDATDLSWAPETGVKLKAKVDGEALEVSLAELRKGYQLQSHYTRQQEEFLRQRREWEAAVQQQAQALQTQAQVAIEIIGHEEEALKARFTRNDWDVLRREDPAEYAAMVAEYNQELQKLRRRQGDVVQGLQMRQQQQAQEYQQRMAQHMQAQGAQLVEKLGWKGEEQIKEKGTRLNQYLQSQGFTNDDLRGVVDHRAFLIADKARQFDELQAKIAKVRQDLKAAPKMPAGGVAATPKSGTRVERQGAMDRLKKDGSVEAAAAVFRNLKVV
jgi:hypothetical protein